MAAGGGLEDQQPAPPLDLGRRSRPARPRRSRISPPIASPRSPTSSSWSTISPRFAHHESGGAPPRDAEDGAGLVGLAGGRFHHPEVAFAVDDLAAQRVPAERRHRRRAGRACRRSSAVFFGTISSISRPPRWIRLPARRRRCPSRPARSRSAPCLPCPTSSIARPPRPIEPQDRMRRQGQQTFVGALLAVFEDRRRPKPSWRLASPPADSAKSANSAHTVRRTKRRGVRRRRRQVADVELVLALAERRCGFTAGSIATGSTGVPGGRGRGSTSSRPAATLSR